MEDNRVLETGYIIYFPDEHEFLTANVGLYKTEQGAKNRMEWWLEKGYNCQVRKVELVLAEEE